MMPLFAVEGILSTSVGITAVLAAWLLGERLGAPVKVAVSLMVAGLVLLSVTAAPETGTTLGLPLVVLAASGIGLLVFVAAFDRYRSVAGDAHRCSRWWPESAFGAWAAVPRLTHDGAARQRRRRRVRGRRPDLLRSRAPSRIHGLGDGDHGRRRVGAAGAVRTRGRRSGPAGRSAAAPIAGYALAVASAVVIAVLYRESSEHDETTAPELVAAPVPSGIAG